MTVSVLEDEFHKAFDICLCTLCGNGTCNLYLGLRTSTASSVTSVQISCILSPGILIAITIASQLEVNGVFGPTCGKNSSRHYTKCVNNDFRERNIITKTILQNKYGFTCCTIIISIQRKIFV